MTYLSPAVRPSGRARTAIVSHAPAIVISLFVVAALISAFSMLNGIDPFDEGLMLQAARRITAGQVPYRDFLWAYGPAQPYLLALLFKLFGASLVQWRIIRVLADAGISVAAYLLASEGAPRPVALGVWLTVACEISEPRSADPFPLALLGILLALLVAVRGTPTLRRVLAAAVLTGLAAAFRLDFALYGLAATAATFLCARGGGLRSAVLYVGAAVAVIALVYLPFAVLDGPASLYQALIGNSLHTRAYWTLPFPLHYHAPAGAGLAKTAKKGLDFYVPLLVVVGYGATVLATLVAWWQDRRAPAPLLGLSVAGAGLVAYVLSRADEFHVQPLFVVVAIGLGVIAARRRIPGIAAGVLLAILLAHGAANRLSALVHPPAASALHVPVADGVQAPPAEARSLDRVVAVVDRLVPPGQPIYVIPRRPDLVRYDDPLLYVLTGRPNPTAQDFGLQAGAAAQAQIVSALARVRPRVIIRWTDPISSSREPNLRGRPTGVHTLDRWVAAHYRPYARLYHYDVLVPVLAADRTAPARRTRS